MIIRKEVAYKIESQKRFSDLSEQVGVEVAFHTLSKRLLIIKGPLKVLGLLCRWVTVCYEVYEWSPVQTLVNSALTEIKTLLRAGISWPRKGQDQDQDQD